MSLEYWQSILNNRIFTGHRRANGTRRLTNSRNNISAAKNSLDTANIGSINWWMFNPDNQEQAEIERQELIQNINTANQLLEEGKRRDGPDGEVLPAARPYYIQSAEMYRDLLDELKTLSPVPIKNFRISDVAPPGTRREHFNFAVRRARETGGNDAADHVIAASHAASAELARATSNRIPALSNAYTRLAAAERNPNITKNALNKARANVNEARRLLYGSATNRRGPVRVAYDTARQYVLAARADDNDMGGAAPRPNSHVVPFQAGPHPGIGFSQRRHPADAPVAPSFRLGLPPTAPRTTSFPFGPPGAGAGAAASLGPAGSLSLTGAPRGGSKKTRRVHRGGMYTLAQKKSHIR
jgi:hypothetical protein